MARKSAHMLPSRQKAARGPSWAVVGGDTSMSSVAFTAMGYDSVLGKMTKVVYKDVRWTTEQDDYLQRLADASRSHELVLDCLRELWVVEPENVYIAVEEPVPLGMIRRADSGWVKQQCEISGAVLGSLYRYGFKNIWQINNAQWKAVLRAEGVTIRKMPLGKWDIKDWAIAAYGLPDLPDLVRGKNGGKIPRPTSGFGAKAKAEQPNDIYDAAACMAVAQDLMQSDTLT